MVIPYSTAMYARHAPRIGFLRVTAATDTAMPSNCAAVVGLTTVGADASLFYEDGAGVDAVVCRVTAAAISTIFFEVPLPVRASNDSGTMRELKSKGTGADYTVIYIIKDAS